MKELRVYLIDVNEVDFEEEMPANTSVLELSDDKFMEIAENQGNVYTINGFQNAFNEEEICVSNDFIRFVEVEVYNV